MTAHRGTWDKGGQDAGAPHAKGAKGGPLGLDLSDAQREQIKSAMQNARTPLTAVEKSEMQAERQAHQQMPPPSRRIASS